MYEASIEYSVEITKVMVSLNCTLYIVNCKYQDGKI